MNYSNSVKGLLTNSSELAIGGQSQEPGNGNDGEAEGLPSLPFPGLDETASDVGEDTGRPTNSGLSIFARRRVGDKGLALRHASKSLSEVVSLYMGIDTAEWSLRLGSEDLAAMAGVFEQLLGQGEVDSDERRFVVKRIGLPWRYKLCIADSLELSFPGPDHPEIPVRVEAGARVCLMHGESLEDEVVRVLGWWLAWADDDIRSAMRLSRVDVCQDLQMSLQAFNYMSKLVGSDSRLVVSRGRYRQAFPTGNGFTGFAIGKNEIRLRVYDKLVDAEKKGTLELWTDVYRGDAESFVVPDGQVVARVEFQLRGEFLRGLELPGMPGGVRTLADFKRFAAPILDYLSSDWFKLAKPGQGKQHERPILPIWKAIRVGFVTVHWSELTEKVKRRARGAVADVERVFDMAVGCLATAAAVLARVDGDEVPKSLGDVLSVLRTRMRDDLDKWMSKAERRYRQLAYSSKNAPVYRDIWTGQPIPLPVPVTGV